MRKAYMIYGREDAKKNEKYIEMYREEGAKRDIQFEVVFVEELEIGVWNQQWMVHYQENELERPDFVVVRTIDPMISRQFERMGIPVFNNAFVAEICNNKALTYQYVAKLHIPMINTIFCKKETLEKELLNTNEPSVFKAVAGHGGSQVFLYDRNAKDAKEQKEKILSGLKGCDFVKQPLTGSRHQDLRVYVIGKQIVAAILRTAKEGFKSNYSLGGEVQSYDLTSEQIEIVNRILDLFDFGLVGIDFIIGDQGELIFNEIEDVVGARMLYRCTDINLVGRYLDYIIQKIA